MPSINFKAKVDQTELDAFQRNAKHKLKEIASEAKVLGKVFGEHAVGKFAKLAALGVGGFGIGAGISLAAIGIEKMSEGISKANEQWKEQIKLVQDLAREYGTSAAHAQDLLSVIASGTPRQRGESIADYDKRIGEMGKGDASLVSKAIKEALSPDNKSRLAAFGKFGITEEMLRKPGNELAIEGTLKRTGISQLADLTKVFGSAREALAFSNAEATTAQHRYDAFGVQAIGGRAPNMTQLSQQANQAELEERVAEAKQHTQKVIDQNVEKEVELHKLLNERGRLNKENLVDAEKWQQITQRIIPLQKEVNEMRKKQANEIHDIQFKNRVDASSKEKRIGVITEEMLEARRAAEILPKGSEDQRRAEIKAEQLKGELQAHEREKARAQFELDTHAKERTWQFAAGEFSARATGRSRIGGFAGTNAAATSNIGSLGETNRILLLMHNLMLQRYRETTFAQDQFNLY